LGDRVVVGAKNLGNRTLNTIDNWRYEARSWISDKFPGLGEPEFAGIGNGLERPTPRPMQSVPERNQPMRMEGNGPDGGTPLETKPTAVDEAERMNPHDIRFTQDTVSTNFSDGGTITDVVNQLRNGKLSADEFPTIRTVEHNGKIYSLDNRRLSAFKAAQIEDIPIQRLDLSNPAVRAEFLKKFKPINDGWNNVVVPATGRAEARRLLREFGKYAPN
jgi:hypothetical protein